MPKRPVTVQSDVESDEEYGPSELAPTTLATLKRTKPATHADPRPDGGRARDRAREAQNEESDAEDEDVDIPVAIDDEEFEKAHEDDARAQIESKKNTKG
jgi:hypothetical protein